MSDIKQEFSVLLYQLFRTAGFTLNVDQNDKLRSIADQLYAKIEEAAKARSVELIRKMQEAVADGFRDIGKDVAAIEKRLEKLEAQPHNQWKPNDTQVESPQ
jgi:hypothetical protein